MDSDVENETDNKVDEPEKKQKSVSSDLEKVNKNILQPQFKAIAVLHFINNTSNDHAGNFMPWEYGFASMIVNDLEAGLRGYKGKYKVVNAAAGDLKTSGRPEELRKITVSTGADFILTGSFSESNGNLKLETQIFAAENGTKKGTASVSGKTKDFTALEKELVLKIFHILGFAAGVVDKKLNKTEDTKSVEASLHNYMGELGIKNAETLKKKGKTKDAQKEIEKARESFEKAVKADPEYEKAKENLLNMPIVIPITL